MNGDELARALDDAGALREWSAEVRIDDARSSRTRQRWHEQLASETSTLAGLLVDLYESSTPARIATTVGREHAGYISALGSNFVEVASADRPNVLIQTSLIASVQLTGTPRQIGAVGGRPLPERPAFAGALAELAANRAKVRLVAQHDGVVRSGELVAAGDGIVTLQLDTPANQTLIITINNISEITIL